MNKRSVPLRTVRTLRHTFRPNEPLQEKLAAMQERHPGSSEPKFILASTRMVAVDAYDYSDYRYDLEIRRLQNTFLKNAGGVALSSVVYRFTDLNDLHLRFIPKNLAEFSALTEPINEIDGWVYRSPKKPLLAIDLQINADKLVARPDLAKAWSSLRDSLQDETQNRLYAVYPNDISGSEKQLAPPKYFVQQ